MTSARNNIALLMASLIGLALFFLLNFLPSGTGADGLTPEGDKTTRREAERAALAFAERQFGEGDWRAFAMYDANKAATGYLNKEKSETEASEVWPFAPLEFFRVEAEESGSGLRLYVYVAKEKARVIGWETLMSESDSDVGRHASAVSALRALGYDPADFEAAADGDGTVFYTHRSAVGKLRFRIEVFMPAGRVLSVVPSVETPGEMETLLEQNELRGSLVSLASLLATFLLGVAAIVFAAVFRKKMAFSRGVVLTLACFSAYAAYTVGIYPALRLETPFEPVYAMFGVLFQLFVYMLNAAVVWLCLVAGEGLWRKMGFCLWPDMRDAAFAAKARRSVRLGYLYAGVILGLQAVVLSIQFWRFDAWVTADPLNDMRNQLFPALAPFVAWAAAISEEAVYRLFAIACFTMLFRPLWRLLHRLTGKPALLNPLFSVAPAALLAGILWGAGHTGYSVYPFYTRWIEVTLIGLLFAWILLRHGLMAAMVAHASVDLLWYGIDLASNGIAGWALVPVYLATPLVAGHGAALFSTLLRKLGKAGMPVEP